MAAQDRKFFQQGINMYVKAMQFAADMEGLEPQTFNLGTPAVQSNTKYQTAIAANAVANTVVALATVAIADSTYGRTLVYVPSGDPGNSNVVQVIGQDYLGQPMVENFTGASGSTAIVYGKKAFFRIISSKVITPSTNAVTYSIGTGFRLGLPYKGDLAYAREAGIQVPFYKRDTLLTTTVAAADVIAGMSIPFLAPFPGFVKNGFGAGAAGAAQSNALTVTLGGVAITGLSAAITNNGAGTVITSNPTTPGYNANNRFIANATIMGVLGANGSSTKADMVGVTLTPTQFTLPDLTDPATALTGDPRGTYEALQVYDGVSKIEAGLVGDNSVNASGNGGFLGIQHFGG